MEAGLLRNIKAKNSEQCRKIAEAVAGDFELQLLVLNTIDAYRAANTNTDGATLSEHLAEKEKTRKSQGVAAAAAGIDHDLVKSRILRRGLVLYKRWGPEMLLELFQYVEPGLRGYNLKQLASLRSRGTELLEFGFDIRCATEPDDRIADENTEVLFPRLKEIYERCGRRLAKIAEHIISNSIVWAEHGVFEVSVSGAEVDARVTVKNSLNGLVTEISPAAVNGDAQGIASKKVTMNFSQVSAFVNTDEDTYILANYFPKLTRELKRSASNENAIVSRLGQPLKRAKTSDAIETSLVSAGAAFGASGSDVASSRASPPRPKSTAAKAPAKAKANAGTMISQQVPLGDESTS